VDHIALCEAQNDQDAFERQEHQSKKSHHHQCGKRSSQTLSEFAYAQIIEAMKSRCRKERIAIREINPAYTSRITKDKYMKPMGCSVHMAASYVITRRACGYVDEI